MSSIARFLADAHDVDLLWLSDGVDLGRDADFIKQLADTVGDRRITVVSGGIQGARALTAADNAAGALSVKVLRVADGAEEAGTARALEAVRSENPIDSR